MIEQPSSRRFKIPRWAWIVIILALVLIFQLWLSGRFSGSENIPLTDVARLIEAGEVELVEVRGNRLTLTLGEGSSEQSVKGEGNVIEQFRQLGVSVEALNTTTIEFIDSSTWNSIVTIVISLGPLLLIIWIFSRTFRKLMAAGKQDSRSEAVEAPAPSNEDRLRQLRSLYDDELVTEVEYETKRAEILSQL